LVSLCFDALPLEREEVRLKRLLLTSPRRGEVTRVDLSPARGEVN
jgi:hypothetical protein